MSERKRIRIVTDERGFTHVYDASGEEIQYVTECVIRLKPGCSPEAELTILDPQIEVEADTLVETTVSYKCLHSRRSLNLDLRQSLNLNSEEEE